jgi:hypothetical protein
MFLSNYYLDRKNIISSMFRAHYTPRFLCNGTLMFAKHHLLGVLGSRLSMAEQRTKNCGRGANQTAFYNVDLIVQIL